MTKEKMKNLVDRLAKFKEKIEEINTEKLSIEAEIQIEAEKLLKDSKLKTIAFGGTGGNRVVVTKANSVKIADSSNAELLEKIFGKGSSRITKKTVYEIDAESKRAISALCTGEYVKGSIKELIDTLECDSKVKPSLVKKIQGKKFETDVKNFIAFAKMDEDDAFVNAYLASEISAYQTIKKILEETKKTESENDIKNLISSAKNVAYVSTTTKIAIQTAL